MAFRLPRWPRGFKLVDLKTGEPTVLAQRWQQSTVEQIEGQEAIQDQMLADIATALEQAGIALDLAGALMPDIPPITVLADYTGTVLSGQLPRNVTAERYDGETNVTTSSAWTAQTLSGSITYTIGAATGIVNITAVGSSAVIEVTSEYNDISRSRKLVVTKQLQDPPVSGSGTTSDSDSTILTTDSTSYVGVQAGPLTLTCGASGEVELTAPLSTLSAATTPGLYGCAGKWQVSAAGAGVWTDVDTEIEGEDSEVMDPWTTLGATITVNQTATGLTPASDYDFQLLLRNTDTTDFMYYYGTATATTE
jgi:hypothetical protein